MSVEFDGIHRVDVGRIFLRDPLEHSLGTSAFDLRLDARVFRFKGLGQCFRYLDIGRRVEDNLAFLPGRLDEVGCYGRGLRRGGTKGKNENHTNGDKRETAAKQQRQKLDHRIPQKRRLRKR